jgi:hypothetical protein
VRTSEGPHGDWTAGTKDDGEAEAQGGACAQEEGAREGPVEEEADEGEGDEAEAGPPGQDADGQEQENEDEAAGRALEDGPPHAPAGRG